MIRSALDLGFYVFSASTLKKSSLYSEVRGRMGDLHSVPEAAVQYEEEEEHCTQEIIQPCNDVILEAVVTIQSHCRGWSTRRLCKAFRNKPSFPAIRRIRHLLDHLEASIPQELELIHLKTEITEKMRLIQQLREDVKAQKKETSNLQDGITMLEDLISRFSKLKKKNRHHIEEEMYMDRERVLERRKKTERLETYQHVFYHLQTQPKYLVRLLCHMSGDEHTRLTERLLHGLYNRASTPREEYHLLKFMETYLQYEVENNGTHIKDIVGGGSMVMKTIFNFYREDTKLNVVLQKLTPVIEEMMKLPSSMRKKPLVMCHMASRVMEAISVESLPYGIRYLAKVLRQALLKQFPQNAEGQVVGTLGLFLHQYLQPVIVDPHEFGVITAEPCSGSLEEESLIMLAMLVGHTMCSRLFPVTSRDDTTLNWYVLGKSGSLCRFFQDLVNVPEPEEEFSFNYYSDSIAIKNPTIDLAAEDIVSTHQLLLTYKKEVFPDQSDVIYKMLKHLPSVPHVEDLLPAAASRDPHVTNTDISLSISSKCVPHEEEDTEREILCVITKKLIVDVLRVQPGGTLLEVLMTPASPEQEEEHSTMMRNTTVSYAAASQDTAISRIIEDHHLPLEKKKEKIRRNLKTLQKVPDFGLLLTLCSPDLLHNISSDISRNTDQWLRQAAEITRLQQALVALETSSRYFQEQKDWYRWYQNNCLEHLDSPEPSMTRKYTAKRLHRKGVIVDTEKRKWLTIECEASQRFKVSASGMCASLRVRDLIELHYSSNEVTKRMFHGVKVSLLLCLVYSDLHFTPSRVTLCCYHR